MIKKILLAIMIALPMMAVAQSKFATVNTQAVLEAMPEVKAANDQLVAASKKYEDEFKKLQDQFEKEYNEFQALDKTTPESIKERRIQEIQTLQEKMQQFHQTAQQDLSRQEQELFAPIQQKMLTAIEAVGKEQSFTFVFPQGAAIYAGTDVVDITPMVKTKLGI